MNLFSKISVLFIALFVVATAGIYSIAQEVGPAPAPAEAAVSDDVKPITPEITKFNDYYRFSFKSTDYQPFDVLIDGSDIIVDFEAANDLDLEKYIYDGSIIKSFGSSGDGKSYIIRANADGLKIRKFIGDDNATGFDLFTTGEKIEKKVIMMSSLPEGEESASETDAKKNEALKYAGAQIVTFPKEFIGPPKIEQLFRTAGDFVGPQQYDNTRYVVYEVMKVAEKGAVVPEIAVDNKGFVLTFPLSDIDSVSAAAIAKDGKVTLVFNTINNILVGDIIENPFIRKVTKTVNDKYKIIEVYLNQKKVKDQYVKAFYKDKFSWILEVYKEEDESKKFQVTPLDLAAENNFGEKRVYAAADGFAGPATIEDEATGEQMKAFLVKDNASGVVVPREFVDLKFLPSLQGIFLQEKADYVSYDVSDKKLFITKLSNLQISDDVISSDILEGKGSLIASSRIKGVYPEESIFPFPAALEARDGGKKEEDEEAEEADAGDEENDEEEKEGEKKTAEAGADVLDEQAEEDAELAFEQTTIDDSVDVLASTDRKDITQLALEYINRYNAAQISEKKSDIKLELAEFYFSKGFFAESLGVVQDIKISDPGYKDIFKVSYIGAAAKYMLQQYGDALDEFSTLIEQADRNKNYSEIRLWQWASKNMFNIKKRNNDEVPIEIDFVSGYDKFMKQYPLTLRYKLGLMFVDEKLKEAKIEEAKNALDIISYNGIPKSLLDDTRFYKAYIASKEGDLQLATKLYEKLLKIPDDRKNRARALVEVTKDKLLKSQISNEEAISNFLQATTIWRDDYFEMDVLEMVGHLYASQKEYIKALEIWKQVANNFPETTESVFILGKMKQLFIELFDGDIAYKMKPLETLKLYFGFRELTPAGELGDRITRKVAQFFITADMMDESMKIIEHQIKFRSVRDEKAKLALWLSKINIDNRDLEGAEKALTYIKENETSPGLITEKKYAIAHITALRGDYQQALDMVRNDFSSPAQKTRTELFWQKENWFGVMSSIESRLNELRETAPLPLTKDEINDINRLIVAYSAQGENKKLESIRSEFVKRIPSNNDQLLFDYLTSGNKYIDYNNFDKTVELEDIERFMNDYSYMPTMSWASVIAIMEPKVSLYIGKPVEELTRDNKMDVVKLGIAYGMLEPKDEREANEMKKNLNNLARDFKDVRVDRFTIDAFNVFDDKYMPKENDAVFEGKIKLTDIPEFVNYYRSTAKFSELNMSIRDKFTN
jgi:hypothetical protein